MAAGSHEEKGYWALLVIASTRTHTTCQWDSPPPCPSLPPNKIRKTASPVRLDRAVSMPLLNDLRFLK